MLGLDIWAPVEGRDLANKSDDWVDVREWRILGARSADWSVSASDCPEADGETRLMDDVRLIPPGMALSSDKAEWVDDLDIPLDPGMTVEEPDDPVDAVWLDRVSNGFEAVLVASLCSLIAGISRAWLGRDDSLTAVFDRGSPRPKPELSLSDSVSATEASRR